MMETVKHYNFELDVNKNVIEYFSVSLPYEVENFKMGDIKKVIISLPKTEIVSLVEREIGNKTLKWFEGLFKKLESTIMKLHN